MELRRPSSYHEGGRSARRGRRRTEPRKESNEAVSSKDLGPILEGWPYENGQLNVRKIRGLDGRMKLQMRLDLGVLQMDVEGRPDGLRPFGCDSLLTHHLRRLRTHRERNGTELGYELSEADCRELRHEAAMYYQRYLALFAMEDFEGVERDTARNLEVLELCRKYAAQEADRYVMEQYRPYILMMNTRAKALLALKAGDARAALSHVRAGIRLIKSFYTDVGHPEAHARCPETRLLRRLRRQIKKQLPDDPVAALRRRLKHALREERYEEAARLRDELMAQGEAPDTASSE